MKLRRLISALIVFTLVMTCALSVVNAADVSYSTKTTKYNVATDEITVETTATVTKDSMVSYIIYDGELNEDNITYIDQQTATDGTVKFTVTDSYEKLGGNSILMGSNLDKLTAAESEIRNNGIVTPDDSAFFVTIDAGIVDEAADTLTFLVSQSKNTYVTGIDVYAYEKGTNTVANVFKGFKNMASPTTDYAITLTENTDDETVNYIDSELYDYKAVPYYIDNDVVKYLDKPDDLVDYFYAE